MAANDETTSGESKEAQPVKTTPKDALVMAAILKEMGVTEYEPRIINQMVEFAYRYVTDTIEDARVYSMHSNRKTINLDDVKLAVAQRLDHSFTSPPPREFLLEVARKKNSQPLPTIPDKSGLRLPPDRHCLTANNFKLKSNPKKGGSSQQRKAAGSHQTKGSSKTLNIQSGSTLVNSHQNLNPSRNQLPMVSAGAGGMLSQPSGLTHPVGLNQTSIPSQQEFPNMLKRKREPDDDYDT